jgi:hypothetical protein
VKDWGFRRVGRSGFSGFFCLSRVAVWGSFGEGSSLVCCVVVVLLLDSAGFWQVDGEVRNVNGLEKQGSCTHCG